MDEVSKKDAGITEEIVQKEQCGKEECKALNDTDRNSLKMICNDFLVVKVNCP